LGYVGESGVDVKVENNYRYQMNLEGMSQDPNRQKAGAERAPVRVSSESLLGPHRELLIVHNGREYRLRLTQNGKLILTA
jgi:hemin uptake protein HemP